MACQDFCRQAVQRRAGRRKTVGQTGGAARCRAVPGRRVRRRQDPPAGLGLPPVARRTHPKAFATFGELTQLAGVFGFVECIDLLADYTAVCIDEFELDDPGNTTLISRLLSSLVERGVSVAATSNTLPEQLGEGRFAAQDFLREINTLAEHFHHRADRRDRTTGTANCRRRPSRSRTSRSPSAPRGSRAPRLMTSMRCARTWPPCTRRGIWP